MRLMQDSTYISGIEPLIAPDAVPFWPPAPGWYMLCGLLVLAAILLLRSCIRRRGENRYRREALHQLKEIGAFAGTRAEQGDVQAVNRLLKKTALSVFPRKEVAPLFGKEWLKFLDKHCSSAVFTGTSGELLLSATSGTLKATSIPEDQWQHLVALAETWISQHKSFDSIDNGPVQALVMKIKHLIDLVSRISGCG